MSKPTYDLPDYPFFYVMCLALSVFSSGCDDESSSKSIPLIDAQVDVTDLRPTESRLDEGVDEGISMRFDDQGVDDQSVDRFDQDVDDLEQGVYDLALMDGAIEDLSVSQSMLNLSSFTMHCNTERARVSLQAEGTLNDSPLVELTHSPLIELRLLALNSDGEPLTLSALSEEVAEFRIDPHALGVQYVVDEGAFSLSVAQAAPFDLNRVSQWTLTLTDNQGQVTQAQTACVPTPTLPEGSTGCDPFETLNQCSSGEGCDQTQTCRLTTTPEIIMAAAALNPEARTLSVTVEGRDEERDVHRVRLLLERADQSLVFPYPLNISLYTRSEDDPFRGRGGGLIPEVVTSLLEAVNARLWLVDDTGLESEELRVILRRPEQLTAQQVCDPLEAFNLCPTGYVCSSIDSLPNSLMLCLAPTPSCPPEWTLESLMPTAEERWTGEGTFDGATRLTSGGSCGDAPLHRAYTFTAPDRGAYRVVIDQAAADTYVIARRLCSPHAPRFELGCGAVFDLFLLAQESITLLVTGSHGPFSFHIEREVF